MQVPRYRPTTMKDRYGAMIIKETNVQMSHKRKKNIPGNMRYNHLYPAGIFGHVIATPATAFENDKNAPAITPAAPVFGQRDAKSIAIVTYDINNKNVAKVCWKKMPALFANPTIKYGGITQITKPGIDQIISINN